MSAPKFTPGPWKLTRNPHGEVHYCSVHVIDERGCADTIADIHLHYNANSHLIAAAPDLFEALCRITQAATKCEMYDTPPQAESIEWADIEKALMALAKARGEV